MKRTLSVCAAFLWASYLLAADANPKEVVLNACKKLAEQPNYGWKMSVEVPDEPTGTIEGKTEKGGGTVFALARGDVSFEAVLKGTKGALKTDEGWKALSEVASLSGQQSSMLRFVAALVQGYKLPAAEVGELAGKVSDLKEAEGAYAGEMSGEAVKELLLYRTRGRNGAEISGAKGSIKIWVKDGLLSKYEFKVHGTLSFNGNEREVDRTHLTEIKAVGTTKVAVPEEAAKLL